MKFAAICVFFFIELVELVWTSNSFNLNNILSSRIYRYPDAWRPCNFLSNANPYLVWTMFPVNLAFMTTTANNKYLSNRYVEDEVDPTRLFNPANNFVARSQTSAIPVILIFQYFNSSHCQLIKVLRNNENPGAAVAGSSHPSKAIDRIYHYYNANRGYNPAEIFKACNNDTTSLCFTSTNFIMNPGLYNPNEDCVVTFLKNLDLTPGQDLDDPNFYRIVMHGSVLYRDNRLVPPETNNYLNQYPLVYWNVHSQNYTGQWLNNADLWANRFALDTHGYGFSIPYDNNFTVDENGYSPSYFPSFNLYVYNFSSWTTTNPSGGIELNVEIKSPRNPTTGANTAVAVFQVRLYRSAGNIAMDLMVNCSLTDGSAAATAIKTVDLGSAMTTALGATLNDPTTGANSDGFTVAMSVAIRYLSRRRYAGDTFDMEAVGLVSIFEKEVDTVNIATFTPMSVTEALSVYQTVTDSRNLDGGWTGGKFWWAGTTSYPTPGVDVRLRAAEYQTGLFDYSYFVPNFYSSATPTLNYCRNPIPNILVGVGDTTKCGHWAYPATSAIADCSRSWGGAMCDYCNPGYGTDTLNYMQNITVCRSKADCDTTYYVTWIDNGYFAINSQTDKALCQSCPTNCAVCDATTCHTCSNYSTWDGVSQSCICNVANCYICSFSSCDICLAYDANLKVGYMVYIDTSTASTALNYRQCAWASNYNCSMGFGYNSAVVFSTFTTLWYPACTSCLLPNCLNCSWNNLACWQCKPGFSVLNLNLALGSDYQAIVNCTNEHYTYMGLFEDTSDPTWSYYGPCPVANCQVCQGNLSQCTTCMPGYHYSPDLVICMPDANCTNTTSYHYLTSNTPQQCEACIANCLYCQDSTTCFNCDTNYLVYQSIRGLANASKCIPAANCNPTTHTFVGTYGPRPDTNTYPACLDCIAHCQLCADSVSCTTCMTGYYYHAGLQMCLTQTDCQNATIKSYVNFTDPTPDCVYCLRNCTQCQNDSFCDVCDSSFPLYHLDDNLCVDSTYCSPLQSSYQVGTSRYCKHCKTGCQNCSTDLNCWQCLNGLVLDADNVTCLAACNPQTCVMNSTHCAACPPNCDTCHYNASDPFGPVVCDTCISGYYFNLSNSCLQCTASLQLLINNTCLTCKVPNCTTCQGGESTCVDCIDQYYVDSNAACQLCVPPLVYTINKTCVPCAAPNCEVCNTADVNRCVKCNKGYYFQGLLCVPHFFVAISANFSADKLQMTVTFQQKLTGLDAANLKMYSLVPNSTNPADNHSMTLQQVAISQSDPKTYFIKVSNLSNDSTIQVYLEFNDTIAVASSEKPTYTLDPSNKTIATPPITRLIKESFFSNLNANSVSTGTTILILLGSLISFNYAVVMMQIYQMMQFMLLYNVEYPYNFKKFILLFNSANPLNSIPDILQNLYDDNCADLGTNFVIQSIGCQFLGNVSPDIFLLLCYLGLRLINTALYYCVRRKSGKIVAFITKLHHGYLGPMGLHFWLSMFDMDILVASFTNSKYYGGDKNTSPQAIGNHLLSQTINYFYPVYLFYYFYKARQIHLNRFGQIDLSEEEVQKYEFLVEDFKEDSWYQKYANIFALSKNYFICMFVVGFYDAPTVQLSSTTLILAITLYLEIRHRPFKKRMEQIVSIAMWSIYLGLSFCFTLLNFVNDHMSLGSIYTFIGNPMIFLFSGLIAVNFIPILISMGTSIWTAYKKCRDRKKNQVFVEVSNKEAEMMKEDHGADHEVEDVLDDMRGKLNVSRGLLNDPLGITREGRDISGEGRRISGEGQGISHEGRNISKEESSNSKGGHGKSHDSLDLSSDYRNMSTEKRGILNNGKRDSSHGKQDMSDDIADMNEATAPSHLFAAKKTRKALPLHSRHYAQLKAPLKTAANTFAQRRNILRDK